MSPAGRRPPLTRDEVVQTALRLTAEQGLGAFSMRAMARELRVTPMALYHHVSDKQELLDLVASEVAARWTPLRPGEEPWEEALRQHLLSMWEELSRHPGLGAHLAGQPTFGLTEAGMEAGIEFFVAADFSTRTARLAWAFALTYVHGRLDVDAHLSRPGRSGRPDHLRARDFVAFGVDAVVHGIRCLRDAEVAETGT